MHGEELKYLTEAYETNWMSTVGNNLEAFIHMVNEIKTSDLKTKQNTAGRMDWKEIDRVVKGDLMALSFI